MATDEALIDWARQEARQLREVTPLGTVRSSDATARVRRIFADHTPGSTFGDLADVAIVRDGNEPGIRTCALQLEEWATNQTSPAATVKPFEVRFRIEAATDRMEQVSLLLKDSDVVPAAQVMLAGAALEEIPAIDVRRVG